MHPTDCQSSACLFRAVPTCMAYTRRLKSVRGRHSVAARNARWRSGSRAICLKMGRMINHRPDTATRNLSFCIRAPVTISARVQCPTCAHFAPPTSKNGGARAHPVYMAPAPMSGSDTKPSRETFKKNRMINSVKSSR